MHCVDQKFRNADKNSQKVEIQNSDLQIKISETQINKNRNGDKKTSIGDKETRKMEIKMQIKNSEVIVSILQFLAPYEVQRGL